MALRIAIQGYEGSFHQIAVQHYLGKDVEVIPCATFRELVKVAVNPRESDGGFMAIENSIAGSILPNYSLLKKSNLKIGGEIYLRIHQHLMANPGVTHADIREIHSHPMALLQCHDFLEKFPNWKLVETEDTALSAKYIHQHRHKHAAAIAGDLAAKIYGLQILNRRIQSNKKNFTRFLYLQRAEDVSELNDSNKASINFNVQHSIGSLAKVLTIVADKGVNLSKLQSMPIPEKEWQYSFHADLEYEHIDQFHQVMKNITPYITEVKIYGNYKKGTTII